MLSATECHELARRYRHDASEVGLSDRRASLFRNIAHSLSALSHQLNMLAEDTEEEKRAS
jgi:hypothetical protein